MKIFRPALIAAILCCFAAGAAFADDIHVVFDPPGPVSDTPSSVTTDIFSLASPISFTWTSCISNPDVAKFAPGLLTSFNGGPETACAEFANLTGAPITQITFDFTGTTAFPGANSVSCNTLAGDPHLTDPSCGAGAPGTFTITFAGGAAIPASGGDGDGDSDDVGKTSLFFIAEDGVTSVANVNTLGWTASVPEPSSLTMLAAGFGLLGLGMVFVKR